MPFSRAILTIVVLVAAASYSRPDAQALRTGAVDPALFADMAWRNIGPYRAGRTKSAAGHPSQPYTFYIGVCNGGVWKTTDAGRTWKPIFDDQPTGSIGSVAVAPSDPNVLYVGSGEGLQRPDLSVGDGDLQIDRRRQDLDASRPCATGSRFRTSRSIRATPTGCSSPSLGHPYGPNEERGVFRSTDGGQTFEKVLFKDENTGGDRRRHRSRQSRHRLRDALGGTARAVGERRIGRGTGGGIYKSTDGGTTWKQLTNGLPQNGADDTGRHRRSRRSDSEAAVRDRSRSTRHGASTVPTMPAKPGRRSPQDNRPVGRIGGGDLRRCRSSTRRTPDMVISASTVAYKSTDGGKTWVALQGRAGRRRLSERLDQSERSRTSSLLVSDQGADRHA